MENWTKYVLDNAENDEILHYCVENIKKNQIAINKALAEEKNQLASEIAADTNRFVELLQGLDDKINGTKKTHVVA